MVEVRRSGVRRPSGVALYLPLLLLFSLYYAFIVTSGTFGVLQWNTHYYEMGADGFRAGHLYLAVQPSAALLAKTNPADPENRSLWLWDTLLFNRHFYIYWGPVPSLCLLAFKLLTGYAGSIKDQWLVLIFALGRLWAGSALILSFSHAPDERQPRWVVATALAVFALASPMPYVLVRPLIYEASVMAGQCFLFCGLLAAFWGLIRKLRLPDAVVRTRGRLLGMCIGLARDDGAGHAVAGGYHRRDHLAASRLCVSARVSRVVRARYPRRDRNTRPRLVQLCALRLSPASSVCASN